MNKKELMLKLKYSLRFLSDEAYVKLNGRLLIIMSKDDNIWKRIFLNFYL